MPVLVCPFGGGCSPLVMVQERVFFIFASRGQRGRRGCFSAIQSLLKGLQRVPHPNNPLECERFEGGNYARFGVPLWRGLQPPGNGSRARILYFRVPWTEGTARLLFCNPESAALRISQTDGGEREALAIVLQSRFAPTGSCLGRSRFFRARCSEAKFGKGL